MTPIWLALASLAPAAEGRPLVGLTLGWENVVNDPFAKTFGPRLAVGLGLPRGVVLEGAASYYPLLGQGGCTDPRWTDLACQLLEQNGISPDVSLPVWSADLHATLSPFRVQFRGWEASAGLMGGLALVASDDDLVALQAVDNPDAIATEQEVHGGVTGGLVGELRRSLVGVRVYSRDLIYIETVNSSTLELKHNVFVGMGMSLWL